MYNMMYNMYNMYIFTNAHEILQCDIKHYKGIRILFLWKFSSPFSLKNSVALC